MCYAVRPKEMNRESVSQISGWDCTRRTQFTLLIHCEMCAVISLLNEVHIRSDLSRHIELMLPTPKHKLSNISINDIFVSFALFHCVSPLRSLLFSTRNRAVSCALPSFLLAWHSVSDCTNLIVYRSKVKTKTNEHSAHDCVRASLYWDSHGLFTVIGSCVEAR